MIQPILGSLCVRIIADNFKNRFVYEYRVHGEEYIKCIRTLQCNNNMNTHIYTTQVKK